MDRIKKLCAYIDRCPTFADVACDHGYVAEYMLKNNLCESAVVSDISPKCLKKAEALLFKYISSGRCRAVCCDGLTKIDPAVDLVVIAGIGGEEIIKILREGFIPQRFVLQPMKNAGQLRKFLLDSGCTLDADDIFFAGGKYYFVLKGGRGTPENYTKTQLLYGRDSLLNPVFYEYLGEELEKKKGYLKRTMTDISRRGLEKEIAQMEEVLKNGLKRNI